MNRAIRAAAPSVRANGAGERAVQRSVRIELDPSAGSTTAATTPAAATGATAAATAMRRPPINAARSYRGGAGGGLLERLLGVIARANQRTGGDRVEPHPVGVALELRELVGMPVPHHRQMVPRGT